ncbi:hypothetical protein MIDIC_60012 [Alphaproteobacteria bacterium]
MYIIDFFYDCKFPLRFFTHQKTCIAGRQKASTQSPLGVCHLPSTDV